MLPHTRRSLHSLHPICLRAFTCDGALRRLLSRALSLTLIFALLATQTPAAPKVLLGAATAWRADFAFWLLSNGWGAAPQGSGRATGRSRPAPIPRPSPRAQEKQADRDTRISRIQIYPGDVTLRPGERVVFTAVAYDRNNVPVGGVRFTWSGQDTGRGNRQMRVTQTGQFEARVTGTYKATVTGAGRQSHAQVRVEESEADTDGQRGQAPPAGPPRRVSTRSLAPGRQAKRLRKDRQRRGGRDSARGGQNASSAFVKSSFKRAASTEAASSSIPAPISIDENEWNDGNYMTADDPGNQIGDPPGSPVDDGASSGNFQLAAPMLALPGRGIDLSLGLAYNSRVWHKANNDIIFDIDHGWPAPGWSLGFGKLQGMGANSGSMIVDADGTRHGFGGQYSYYGNFSGHTTDGTFIDYSSSASYTGNGQYNGPLYSGQAKYPNGTIVQYGAPGEGAVYPTRITDANGNYVTVTYRNNTGPQIETVIDTLGRTVNFYYDANNLLTAVTAPGYSPESGYPAARTLVRLHYRQLTLGYGFSGLRPMVRNQTVWVIDAIYYPGTGTGYWFGDTDSYSSYGMIRKVSEQSGMTLSAASLNEQGAVSAGAVTRQMTYDYPQGPDYSLTDAPTYPKVTEEWAGMDAAPAVVRYNARQDASPRTVEVTQPDGTRSVQYSYNNPGQFNDGLVYQDETYDENNRLLSKSTVTWEQGAYESPRPARTEVTDERGQVKAMTFGYGPLYNQVGEVREYGYGGQNLLRMTRTGYENGASYTNRHIFNLPKTVEIYAANGATRESRTEYEYDAAPLEDAPGVTQHDEAYNPYAPEYITCDWHPDPDCDPFSPFPCEPSSQRPWIYNCVSHSPYRPETNYRGNVTKVVTYADAVNLTGAVTETRSYDITGNMVTASTSCCEQTRFLYSSSTQYAYPFERRRGSSDPTNLNALVSTIQLYDFNTGLVTYTQGADGRAIYLDYYPETLRQKSTYDYSTGAQTVFSYDDAAMIVGEVTYAGDGTVADQNVKYLNGRGQVRREEALGGGNTWDVVETKYDVFGRVSQQTRPFRSGETPQWSTTTYDALGRVSKVRAPEGSEAQTFYNEAQRPSAASDAPGETVRMVDAWGHERWGRTDARGRLAEVVELDPTGLRTEYSYNTLDNLMEVAQGAQRRRFAYDALGRLTRQKLAEQSATLNGEGRYVGTGAAGAEWSDFFVYDERSNLVRRVDARGVQTVFNHGNDPLNRLQSVTYDTSGVGDAGHPVAPAPMVRYDYRQRPDASQHVDVTQVKKVTTEGVSTEEYDYDNIGRVREKTLALVSRPAYPQVTSYVLDSLDRVTDVRYPAQYMLGAVAPARKLVHHNYDVASRLSGVQVDGADYASELNYNAASQTTSLRIGAGAQQTKESYEYDPATGLLTNQKVERGTERLLDLSYDYLREGTTSGRTGQLTKITNNLDQQKNRRYRYDALGRLARAIGGEAQKWLQCYSYDRYGNRLYTIQTESITGFVRRFFQGALGRQPDAGELQEWTGRLRAAYGDGSQPSAMLGEAQELGRELFEGRYAAEYAARGRNDREYVSDLYRAYLQREPDQPGWDFWTQEVAQGGRAHVRRGFDVAGEFAKKISTVLPDEQVSPLAVPLDGLRIATYDAGTNRMTMPGWEYDAAGNQTRVERGAGTWQRMQYDAANRLVKVTSDDGRDTYASYTYGDSNQRLISEEGGARTYYAWSGAGVIAEYVESISANAPQWTKSYIYFGARLLSTIQPNGGGGEYTQFHHPDRLGTRLVTNASDSNSFEQVSLPFGTPLNSESTGATNRRFTSYDRSASTGLDYAVNRFYDAQQGRFTQVDPIGMDAADLDDPQSFNRYSYVQNDPVNFVDPSGLDDDPLAGCTRDAEGRYDCGDVITIPSRAPRWDPMQPLYDLARGAGDSRRVMPEMPADNGGLGILDGLQTGLDLVGISEFPIVSSVADLCNAAISFGRGDNVGGVLSLGAAVPGAGAAANAVRLGRRARAAFEVAESGVAIPTSRARLERGFRDAGFNSYPNRRTPEPGTNYIDPANGNIYRVMQGSGAHPPRLMTHSPRPGNPPLLPDGSPIPSGLRGNQVRSLTHCPLEP